MQAMQVASVHSIKEVMDAMIKGARNFGQYNARLTSYRMRNFFKHGIVCVQCGVQGTEFRVERHNNKASYKKLGWHINLYASRDGGFVLMTADHIIPKSLGGTSDLRNIQPMCSTCNNEKGSSAPGTWWVKPPEQRTKPGKRWNKKKRYRNGWAPRIMWSRVFTVRWIIGAFKNWLRTGKRPFFPWKWEQNPKRAAICLKKLKQKKSKHRRKK